MASYEPVVKNGAAGAIITLGLPSATVSATMQTNPTLAAGDVQISKDGGALANLTTLPAVTPAGSRLVKITLSQAETNADSIAIVFADQTAPKEWCDTIVSLNTVARNFDNLAFPNTSGRGMTVDAAGLVDATTVKVGPTGAGTAQTAGDIPARLPAALVGGKMDSNLGTVTAGAITAAAFAAGAIDANAIATDAIGSAELAATAVTKIQTGLATSAALATVQADTDDIQTRLPAALVGGKMDANLGTVTAGAITAAAFAAGAITANAIATDAIGAAELAADAVAEIQAGLATSASIAAIPIPTAAQNANALLDQVDGVETGLTFRQWLRLAAAILFGKASGLETSLALFRSTTDTKTRVTATVDADGNRTSVTLDPS